MLQQTFAYILEKKAFLHPEHIAIKEAHSLKTYTYWEIYEQSNRLANLLKGMGVKKGDRVSCITANTVEYIELFIASSRLGIILNPMNYRMAPFEMTRIVDDAKPRGLIFDVEFSDAAYEIMNSSSGLEFLLYFGGSNLNWANNMEEEMEKQSSIAPEIEGDAEDPLLMLYTAGSTGRPKGVPLKQRNLFFNALNWIIDVGITKEDYTMTVIPLFHIGGHMLWTLPHLLVGGKILLQRRFEPEKTLRLIAEEKSQMCISFLRWQR